MKLNRTHALVASALAVAGFASLIGAQGQPGQDVKALYDRMDSLNSRIGTAGPTSKVYNEVSSTSFVTGTNKLTYRRTVKGGAEFMLVDIATQSKAPAFDHTRLAAALSAVATANYTAVSLPFQTFTFVEDMKAIEFQIGAGAGGRGGGRGAAAPGAPAAPRYKCTLSDYGCARLPDVAPPPDPNAVQGGGAQGRGAAGGRAGGAAATTEQQTRPSPDGKWEAYIQNYNIFLRPLASTSGGGSGNGGRQGAGRAGGGRQGGGAAGPAAAAQPVQLSWDGSEGNPYQLGGRGGGGGGDARVGNGGGNSMWSPDSKKIAAYRVKPGYDRHVTYVQSSPADQVQPKSYEGNLYRKPGDELPLQQPSLFDVETKKETAIDNTLFPTPYSLGGIQWRRDSRAFTFDYNQRGHQVYRVVEVDANSGKARAVIEEKSKTFIYYNAANATMSPGDTYINSMNDGKEIIWMSQRDGWKHLYLYDGLTGQVRNQITKGQWVVHSVDRVDEQARQIYFLATGMDAGKDPYLFTYCRINFDGTGLVRYTPADGSHDVPVFSADRQYYVDMYTRVDLPRVAELRKASDQSLVMTLEKADPTDLLATGWKMPEVFTAKGRDGQTDIWGIIIKPTNFDPAKKYPVIENIYAGPQGSFVPKTFSTQGGMQGLAELGFIVVQVDGMGTANRSKAFHDVAYKNLGDAGFPDRILWHKAIAAKYPWYDITRVGIYGTSAGGQNSLGGMLFHPEFYKVAVTNSGCHDNRMDKIWWNEQWMGWPLGPEYSASSNTDNAKNLKGKLMLVVPELDTNVDPSSTMQVVNKLVQAGKEFELVVIPGADHGAGSPITVRKRNDFFVKNLLGLNPPNWNDVAVASATTTAGNDEPDYAALESLGNFQGSFDGR